MDRLTDKRTRVLLHKDHISNVSGIDFPGNFPGEDLSWNLEKFQENFKIVISSLSEEEAEIDLIGVDASIANALRRIMISEVPTVAIEKVYMLNNSSIMHDEILSHRLGLIPIMVDPRDFTFKTLGINWMGRAIVDVFSFPDDEPNDKNTVVMQLKVKCEINPNAKPNAVNPADKYINSSVYSSAIEWLPQGDQEILYKENPIRPVHKDILITKLRPGQEIEAQLHCQKGIGKEHAKWSPVATASYRLLPEITILEPIVGESAERFQACFAKGVVEVFNNDEGVKEARVVNPRKDTVSREVLRHKEFEGKVRLSRIRDHFIFRVESTGILKPDVIFDEALTTLIDKCKKIKDAFRWQVKNVDDLSVEVRKDKNVQAFDWDMDPPKEAKDDKKAKKRKPREASTPQRLKVVVRRLPPNLPEHVFKSTISAWSASADWIEFIPGKLSKSAPVKEHIHARAYINFTTVESLMEFFKGYNGWVFKEEKTGLERRALVEMAPYAGVPKKKRKADVRMNTIEDDADYKAFMESLKFPAEGQITKKPSIASLSSAPTGGDRPKSTPLLDDLRAKKSALRASLEQNRQANTRREKEEKHFSQKKEKGGRDKTPPKKSEVAA
ncbi:DNA-directed RNA polymerases I and III subunit RPAC1, partial [Irineochytrium annulatum]